MKPTGDLTWVGRSSSVTFGNRHDHTTGGDIVIPPTLVDNLRNGLCVPWCGAGISIPSGMPSWYQLVNEIIAASRSYGLNDSQESELQEMLQGGALEDVVDFCRDFLGEGEYRNFLQRILEAGRQPSSIHRLIADWPVPAILTSNYDRLIEAAITQKTGNIPKVLTADDTQTLWQHFAKDEYFVLKVHGDIVRPPTVVLTSRDYTNHVFGNLPFMTFLQRVVLSRSVFFVGSSLQDIYLRRILEETTYMTGGVGMPHFALLPNPGTIRSRLLRDRYNIIVVPYDPDSYSSHEEAVVETLSGIAQAAFENGEN